MSLKSRSLLRPPRRRSSPFAKLLKSAARATRTAVRQGEKAAQQAQKTLRAIKAERPRRAPGRFVEIDGLRVHYIARGKGRPVVLLHGNGTMAEDFVICGLLDQLAKRYRVIAIDRPGFGHTERPRHRVWTASAQAHLVHRVLGRLNVERPLIVGHSWGTLVALTLAHGGWRDLRGLVLLSGYFYPTRRADIALSAPLAIPGLGDAARAMVPQAVGHLLAPHAFRHVFSPQPVPPRFTARFPVEIAMHATQLRASAEDTATLNAAVAMLQPGYARLQIPLAIITGDADAVVAAADHSRRLHADVPGSTLAILPGIGHMIHYSARGHIARAIDKIMAPGRLGRAGKAGACRGLAG